MTAPVLATVASFNRSKVEDLAGWNMTFLSDCEAAQQSTWAFDSDQSNATGGVWAFVLVDHPSPENQTQQYLDLYPPEVMNSCEGVSPYVQQYHVIRQQCERTWSVWWHPACTRLLQRDHATLVPDPYNRQRSVAWYEFYAVYGGVSGPICDNEEPVCLDRSICCNRYGGHDYGRGSWLTTPQPYYQPRYLFPHNGARLQETMVTI